MELIILSKKEKVLLVTTKLLYAHDGWKIKDLAFELKQLALSCGSQIEQELSCTLDKITVDLYIGKGKAQELSNLAAEEGFDTVIFNNDL
ncbi:MAG: GTPase HflX, partial [Candidatus Gygaella obscura]|nr:GTPase HflX [Candidatus Gygaella obscura]